MSVFYQEPIYVDQKSSGQQVGASSDAPTRDRGLSHLGFARRGAAFDLTPLPREFNGSPHRTMQTNRARRSNSVLADTGILKDWQNDSIVAGTGITVNYRSDAGTYTINADANGLLPTTTEGDVLYHDGTNNNRLAKGTASQALLMNSGATAPEWGTVAIAGGGTGQTTQTAGFDALAPTTTQADIIYHDGTDNVRLAKGTALQVLAMNAGATAPEWSATSGVFNLVDDLTPQLGGDLDCNTFDIQFDTNTGIRDSSDNEQLVFDSTVSAINHFEIANAAAGTNPVFKSAGDDTNVDLELDAAGTGNIVLSQALSQKSLIDNGSPGATLTVDWNSGNFQKVTLTQNLTLTFTAPSGPTILIMEYVQDSTGTWTITEPASTTKHPSGMPTGPSTGANEVSLIRYYFDGTNYYAEDAVLGAMS